ncbi:receptor-interacting serine/threonine-protein kinase 3 isoform 1-T3 [Discoglossus pictus]
MMERWKRVCLKSLDEMQFVGEGTFGTIYRSRHKEWKIDVAVKKINCIFQDVSQAMEDLISEAKKMDVASQSPYVIRLYGMLKDDTCRGIVMEFMERGSLDSLLENAKPIPWALKFRILHEVALGMNWLHSLSPPLLHLDLKASNVLLNPDLHVKISDFGLSQFIRNNSMSGACSEEVGGTLEYMPPEAFGSEYKPSKSTDVYSFAILCSTVLTEDGPYHVANSDLIRIRVVLGDRPSLKSLEELSSVRCLNEAIPFIERCWHQNILERPPFSECCGQWETIFLAHKADIINAVRQVQDKMMATGAEYAPSESTGTEFSSNMSEMASTFKTLNITCEASVKQMAAPPTYNPINAKKCESQFVSTSHPDSSASHQTRPKDYAHDINHTAPKADYPSHHSHHQAPGSYPSSKPAGINPPVYRPASTIIINEACGVQIGNNNVMTVTGTIQNRGSSSRPWSSHTVYGVPGGTWQSQTSYPRPRGERLHQNSFTTSNGAWPFQPFPSTPWPMQPSRHTSNVARPFQRPYRQDSSYGRKNTQPTTASGVQPRTTSPHDSKQRSSQTTDQYHTEKGVKQNTYVNPPKPSQ